MADKNTLKSWFEENDQPTQEQFWALIDSFFHKQEKIPISAINDIENILGKKIDAVEGERLIKAIEISKLGNLDNTKDIDKPVSTAQAIAITAAVSNAIVDSQMINGVTPASTIPASGNIHTIVSAPGTYVNWNNIVVPANTLGILSRVGGVYSSSLTTIAQPENKILQWVAQDYASGAQVNHLGKDWVSNAAIISTDIPGTSSKWVERLSYIGKKELIQSESKLIASISENLFDNNQTTEGYISYSTGNFAAKTGVYTSNYMIVNAGETLYQFGSDGNHCYFDANLDKINFSGQSNNLPASFVVPTGAKYIRISFNKGVLSYLNRTGFGYTLFGITKDERLSKSDEFIPFITAKNVFKNSSGLSSANATLSVVNEKLYFTNTANANSYLINPMIVPSGALKTLIILDIDITELNCDSTILRFKNVDNGSGFNIEKTITQNGNIRALASVSTSFLVNTSTSMYLQILPGLSYTGGAVGLIDPLLPVMKIKINQMSVLKIPDWASVESVKTKLASVLGFTEEGIKLNTSLSKSEISQESKKTLKIAFLGDSITAANYMQFLSTKNFNVEVTNYGIGGNNLSSFSGSTAMCVRWVEMADGFDSVVVFGGTNDYGNDVLIGTPALSGFNPATICGAVGQTITGLQQKYKGKTIFFVTPPNRHIRQEWKGYGVSSINGYKMSDYSKAIHEQCLLLGVPVIDVQGKSGINWMNMTGYPNLWVNADLQNNSYFNTTGGIISETGSIVNLNYFEVLPSKNYQTNYLSKRVVWYDIDKVFISSTELVGTFIGKPPVNARFCRLSLKAVVINYTGNNSLTLGSDSIWFSDEEGSLMPDRVHPNEAGQKRIANIVSKALDKYIAI